jgi:hypothetical protein
MSVPPFSNPGAPGKKEEAAHQGGSVVMQASSSLDLG